jgi:hypothetical protein
MTATLKTPKGMAIRGEGNKPQQASSIGLIIRQSLTAQDQLFVLMQAAAYLTATRGSGALEARICYERAESLSHSLGRPLLLRGLIGQ